ncbi:MAG TPA: ubiquinol-cytochrome c reductase iron-sulfur subunit N-terminal domain-containing protein [Methylovirgula sp.]
MPSSPDPSANAATPPKATRRDFLYIATAAFAGVGAAAAAVPLFSQMEPDASALAAGGPVDIDLKTAAPGQNIIALWRSRPVYILRRPANLLANL